MAEWIARRPLDGDRFEAPHLAISVPSDLRVRILTARDAPPPDAIRVGRDEWLAIAGEATAGQDITPGVAVIDVSGAAAFDVLGIASLARAERGTFVTRIAGLRIAVHYAREGSAGWARLIAERCSADYVWAWLIARAALERPA